MPSVVRIHLRPLNCGSSSVDRASAFQAEGRGFEPRLPLKDLQKRFYQRVKPFLCLYPYNTFGAVSGMCDDKMRHSWG